MGRESIWTQLCKPQFVEQDPEIPTLLGLPSARAGSIAAGAALMSAFLVIPAVFLAASKDELLRHAGIWLGYVVWAVFLTETLVFIRLEKGWGGKWLRKHWLQVLVIIIASPFAAIVLEHAIMPLVSVLFSMQNFLSLSYVVKLFSGLKIVKLLHLEEVRQKVRKSAQRVKWVYRATVTSVAFCGLGILGAAASGGAPTPLHGLELWWDLVNQSIAVAPELLLVTIPIVIGVGGFAIVQNKLASGSNRQI
jgi:hypothetical protein